MQVDEEDECVISLRKCDVDEAVFTRATTTLAQEGSTFNALQEMCTAFANKGSNAVGKCWQ